jgi:hypothetical protein
MNSKSIRTTAPHGLCSYSYESPLIAGFSFEKSSDDSQLPALRKALGQRSRARRSLDPSLDQAMEP